MKNLSAAIIIFFPFLVMSGNVVDSLKNILFQYDSLHPDTSYVKILHELCKAYKNQGMYEEALNSAQNIISISEKINSLHNKATAIQNIGLIYYEKGNLEKALEYYLNALSVKEKMNDKFGISSTLNNIGLVYVSQKKYNEALEYFNNSKNIIEQFDSLTTEHKRALANTYNNLGLVQYYSYNFDASLKNIEKGLLLRQEIKDIQKTSESYTNIGNVYFMKQDFKNAVKYYSQTLEIFNSLGDRRNAAIINLNMGELHFTLNDFENGVKSVEQAIKISKEIGAREILKECFGMIAAHYSKNGDFKKAYEYHKLYSETKDSIFNSESSKQIAEMQTKYETEKKELQIENLNKDNAIKETEIKKQNFQKLAFAGGFGLMLILAFVIFRGYNQKKKANEIISAQKSEVEKQKELVDEKNKSLEIAYHHIEEKNTEILDSIRYAKRIQEAILPPQKLVKSYLENSFILYKPKDIVAGDFYWMYSAADSAQSAFSDKHSILFASVDCTGHGVPGAFVSILGYNGLNRCVKEFGLTKPSEILDKLCELVDEAFSKSENDIKDGMDIALVNLTLNPYPMERDLSNAHTNPERVLNPFGVIQYAGAGNSLYHIRNGVLTEYSPDKQPIGKFAYRKPFTNHEIQLEKGDSIYIFTDGYADQFGGPKRKKFKYKQFENLLLSIQEKSMTEQREILNTTIEEWRGEMEQIDDICILGVRV